MRSYVLSSIVVVSLCAISVPADAICTCMLRPPRVRTVGQGTGVDTDPSYTPTAAVFVLRDGTRTILTMEAAYTGPPTPLSMVIPVPSPIERDQVRTVTGSVFRTLDRRTAPRIRHVWPNCVRRRPRMMRAASADSLGGGGGGGAAPEMIEYGVDIEDEWPVDEYDMTLLGATESTGLLRFLRDRGLELPDVAAEVLRAYIETNHRFILATVDPSRAQRLGDKMMLSPIQLEYEAQDLRVPVRLGTLNSPGEQELLLYVLSTDGRYEVANRPNVVAPSDLRLTADARGSAAELYTSISNEIFRRTPGAAVTEFAHLLGSRVGNHHVRRLGFTDRLRERETRGQRDRWTLTRIRHRYGTDLDDDLMLRPASEPLRLSRRWRSPELRVWGRRGESAFHVQYIVEHPGRRCPTPAMQRRYASAWANAESMWEASNDVWPGTMLADPIPDLEIEAGSQAPDGWPPPPPELQPPPIERRDGPMEPLTPRDSAPDPQALATEPEETAETPPEAPPASPPPATEETGFCAAAPWSARGAGGELLLLLGALTLLLRRRR